jgi:hypothetical protein
MGILCRAIIWKWRNGQGYCIGMLKRIHKKINLHFWIFYKFMWILEVWLNFWKFKTKNEIGKENNRLLGWHSSHGLQPHGPAACTACASRCGCVRTRRRATRGAACGGTREPTTVWAQAWSEKGAGQLLGSGRSPRPRDDDGAVTAPVVRGLRWLTVTLLCTYTIGKRREAWGEGQLRGVATGG